MVTNQAIVGIAVTAMCLVSSFAAAGPIQHWSDESSGAKFEHLSDDDLTLLASRDDRGWHLGWFGLDQDCLMTAPSSTRR
jgi:hypothetical protein